MKNISCSGNKGKTVRSDCFITLEIDSCKGIEFSLESKVGVMYGKKIENLVREILEFYSIKNAKIIIEDSGALDFVIAARTEAAVKLILNEEKEFLPDFNPANSYSTARDINRFSRLYLPGNNPSLMLNAGVHKPHGIILDLEDAVAFDRKYEARFLVRNALCAVNFYGAERMVRINQIPAGIEDLKYVVPHNPNLIIVPKCESAKDIQIVNENIDALKKKHKITSEIWLMPIIESALGVVKSYEIASAAPNIVAMAIGLEDYTADIGTQRTQEGTESLFARCQIVNSCRAAGIQPIDSVFSDVADLAGLEINVKKSKALGFEGMGCIHPRQIKIIHDYYAPADDEIKKAKKIVLAFDDAQAKGLGVISLGSKMIDPPVVKRALNTIVSAVKTGKLNQNWKEAENV